MNRYLVLCPNCKKKLYIEQGDRFVCSCCNTTRKISDHRLPTLDDLDSVLKHLSVRALIDDALALNDPLCDTKKAYLLGLECGLRGMADLSELYSGVKYL